MCIPQVVATSAAWSHLRPNFLGRLTKMRIIDPTPCQRQVLPALMPKAPSELAFGENARMAVIQWPTGSGKTLSYMLPMMERLNMHATGTGVQGLILVPTRVVGLQTMRTLRRMAGFNKKNSKGNQIKAMALLGDIDHMDGRKRRIMETELAHRTPDVAVGTPKMVRQLLENDLLPLHLELKGRMLVLDEVYSLAAPLHWEENVEAILRHGGDGRKKAGTAWSFGSMWLVSAIAPEKVARARGAMGSSGTRQ